MSSYQKFEHLRWKLIDGKALDAGKLMGESVAEMLRKIKDMRSLQNPYCLPTAEMEQLIAELRQRITNIKMNIESM
jgi:hypothetical protein